MAASLTRDKLLEFLRRIGNRAGTVGACYLTGGTSAVLIGWRETTIDIDLKFDPEPAGVFEAIPELKNDLEVNIELAAPDQFIPALTGWKERSRFIEVFGNLTVYHYDFVSQALSKLSRGHGKDLSDVRELIERGLITPDQIRDGMNDILPRLIRYPAIHRETFVKQVDDFLKNRNDDK